MRSIWLRSIYRKTVANIMFAVLIVFVHGGAISAFAQQARPAAAPNRGPNTGTPPTVMNTMDPRVQPRVTGGTTNFAGKFTDATSLGNSSIFETGGNVGISTTTPLISLDVRTGSLPQMGIAGTTDYLTFFASDVFGPAIYWDPGKDMRFGKGGASLYNPFGFVEQMRIQSSTGNVGIGTLTPASKLDVAGDINLTGGVRFQGTAVLQVPGGVASSNIALGAGALANRTTGTNNIAIGNLAANSVAGVGSNNIHIGSTGSAGDSAVVRIGTAGTQTSFFAAGIRGVTTGSNDAIPVMIDSSGQLGTVSSSRRFKEDIQDMGDASRDLMRLRPVTFRYKQPFSDGSKPVQYGLIAEEVAEIYPDLIARSADGEIETVKYQVLDSMLLNEFQRQDAEIKSLEQRIVETRSERVSLEQRLANLEKSDEHSSIGTRTAGSSKNQ